MEVRTIFSEKKRKLLLIDGHKFSFQKQLAGELKRWICTSKKTSCKACVKTDAADNVLFAESVFEHNHESFLAPVNKKTSKRSKEDHKSLDSIANQSSETTQTKHGYIETSPVNSLPISRLMEVSTNTDMSGDTADFHSENGKTIVRVNNPPKYSRILIQRERSAPDIAIKQVNKPKSGKVTDLGVTMAENCTKCQKLEENANKGDADIFGMGVAAKVRKLKNEKLKIRVQRDIDMLLYDAIMGTGRYSDIEEVNVKAEPLDESEILPEKEFDSYPYDYEVKVEEHEIS